MKRIVSLILASVFILLFVLSSAVAVGAEEAKNSADEFSEAVSFTCVYDVKKSQVIIDGTVSHDFLISHGNYKINVYSFLPGKDYSSGIDNENAKKCAESAMSVKFTFYIDAKAILERFSRYAIVFSSQSGENFLSGQPMLPSISSSFEYDPSNREGFKGILSESAVDIGRSGAGTVVVDVELSELEGDSSDSILYPMRDSYVHMKKSYINEIDKKVASATLNGSNVYLRLLFKDKNSFDSIFESEKYSIPNLYSESVLEYVCTALNFLAERYDGKNGEICGVIVGTRIDDVENSNFLIGANIDEYADLYTLYLVVVGNAMRAHNNKFDIVIPFSDRNDYTADQKSTYKIPASELLEKIVRRLDRNVSGRFDCSLMIESDTTPLGITNQSIGEGINKDISTDNSKITPDTLGILTGYINTLIQRYESVPSDIVYKWNVPDSLSGNALSCAYAYSYLTLFKNTSVSAFVIDIGKANFDSLSYLMRRIDTDKAQSVLSPLTKYFGAQSWDEITGKVNVPIFKSLFEKSFSYDRPENILGEFQYIDFSASNVFERITAGENVSAVRLDYDPYGVRAFRVDTAALKLGQTAEIIGAFEFAESYVYTPDMSLRVEIVGTGAASDALYEICLTVGNTSADVIAQGYVRNGEKAALFFNAEDFSREHLAEHIRLSVRPLSGDCKGVSLWIHELRGYSGLYDSDTLSRLVEEKRMEIRNENVDSDSGFDYSLIITVIGVVISIAAVAAGLLIVFKRDDENQQEKQE